MVSDKISSLLRDVQEKGEGFEASEQGNSQRQLLNAAQALVHALESPADRICRMLYAEPFVFSITRTFIDLDLFNKLLEENGTPKTTAWLAEACGAEKSLLERLLKHLATSSLIDEVGVDTFGPTPATALLATPECTGAVMDMFDATAQFGDKLPKFLKEINYRNPIDKTKHNLFNFATGIDVPYFDWLYRPENADRIEAFKNHMGFKTVSKKWYETVPLDEILGTTQQGDALLVDVGGNTGYDLQGFHQAHPDRQGKLVLQDSPAVVANVKLEPPFEVMAHDFFTPQPVKGASAYYMKMVLHDWGDEDCGRILRNIRAAMTFDSRILINEMVIPLKGADWFATGVDILMLAAHSSYERTERDWDRLAECAGLRVKKIWDCGGAMEKLIEMVVA
ncbi:O-methyltransferase [Xylariaceae sp. FL0255]|nr:O-methyltransferase [Xylariaceae sp. FL0255]